MSLYDLLEVSSNATPDELKRAYYRLALKFHPDKSTTQTDDKFKMVSEAYSILSDPAKRAAYDKPIPDRLKIRRTLKVTFEELMSGGERDLEFFEELWLNQHGETIHPISCPVCRGKRTIVGTIYCHLCRGTRQVYPEGRIKAKKKHSLKVVIPPQSWPGRLVTVDEISIELQPTDPTRRLTFTGETLIYTHRLSIFQALLGINQEIIIIPGQPPQQITHPDPITTVSEITIPEAGLYNSSGNRGPLMILFEIEFPKSLHPTQRQLLTDSLQY